MWSSNGSKKVINILQIQKCMCLCVHDENLFVGSQWHFVSLSVSNVNIFEIFLWGGNCQKLHQVDQIIWKLFIFRYFSFCRGGNYPFSVLQLAWDVKSLRSSYKEAIVTNFIRLIKTFQHVETALKSKWVSKHARNKIKSFQGACLKGLKHPKVQKV